MDESDRIFSRSGGAEMSCWGSTRGFDLDPFGRPGLLGAVAAVGGAIRIVENWAQTPSAAARSTTGSSASSSASTLTATSSRRSTSNSHTAPYSDAPPSALTGRNGILGRVTVSASRDRRGKRKAACNGGAEQWAGATSSGAAVTMPRKTNGLLGDDMAMAVKMSTDPCR